MKINHPEIEQKINDDNEIKPDTKEALDKAIAEFKQSSTY